MEILEELEKVKNILISEFNCEAIILFGSYSNCTQTEESDIDIAIKTDKQITKIELFDMSNKLEEILKKDVDLVNLDNIDDGIRYEILINGQTLYCKDDYKFDLYKLDMYREYLELNESRKDIIDNIKNGGSAYGK